MATLSEEVQALAEAGSGLGGWFRFESSAAATGADAARQVVVADLADDDDGGTSYEQGYLYATDGNVAGQQRRVSVYDGSSGSVATFTTAAPFSATPASGITWEYSAQLPRNQHGVTPGLREILNQARRKLWVEDRITLTGNGGYAYPLAAYPWLREQAQLGEIYDTTVSTINPYRLERPRFRRDAEAPYLETTVRYSAAQTFDLQVYRPANSRLKIGGTWAEQASPLAGLVDDEDESLVPLDDLIPVALAYAYAALAYPLPGTTVPYWEAKAEAQKLIAGMVKALSLPAEAGGGRLVMVGGGRRSGYWP